MDARGTQAKLEVVEVTERVERGTALHLCIAQQPGLAIEASIAPALEIFDIGQVTDTGIQMGGLQIDRWLGSKVVEGQGAVVDTHLVQGNRQQLFQLLTPVGTAPGLRCLPGTAVNEVQFGA
ncbi:hypothetical protein D3C77_546450 [compost metagenome]